MQYHSIPHWYLDVPPDVKSIHHWPPILPQNYHVFPQHYDGPRSFAILLRTNCSIHVIINSRSLHKSLHQWHVYHLPLIHEISLRQISHYGSLYGNHCHYPPLPCMWTVPETIYFLIYWLIATASLNLIPSCTHFNLCSIIDTTTLLYHELYSLWFHSVATFTTLIGTKTFEWSIDCQAVFDSFRGAMIPHSVFLRHHDHHTVLHIYTDASNYQIGSTICFSAI